MQSHQNAGPAGPKLFIHQIFYDAASRAALDPGFIALDNSANPRPDWYEFYVMLSYLRNHQLEEGAWYGFLSPKFVEKSGFSADFVKQVLAVHDQSVDVALFTVAWDQIAYFENVFEQGEAWHPGITALTQQFLNRAEIKLDLQKMVSHSMNTVLSNYVIAKPCFWREWLRIAAQFWEHVEHCPPESPYRRTTSYGSLANQTPMKTFIQERLACIVLARQSFRAVVPDQSAHGLIWDQVFAPAPATRRTLQACDLLKQAHSSTGDMDYLTAFRKLRATIPLVRR